MRRLQWLSHSLSFCIAAAKLQERAAAKAAKRAELEQKLAAERAEKEAFRERVQMKRSNTSNLTRAVQVASAIQLANDERSVHA